MGDLFDKANSVTVEWTKWDEVGKTYQGTFVETKEEVNTLKGDGSMQTVYVLIKDDGSLLHLTGPGGRELKQMAAIKPGSYIGVRYEGDIDPPKAGWNKIKQVTVYFGGEMRPEVVQKYRGAGVFEEANKIPDASAVPEM